MKDVWNKFESKLTATGIQFQTEKMTKKKFPLLTICPRPSFKQQGMLKMPVPQGNVLLHKLNMLHTFKVKFYIII